RVAAPSTPTRGAHLVLNPIDFENCFSRKPFLIQHSLCDHPLFQIERILELTKTLPEKNIEYNFGKLPVSVDHSQTPQNGLSPEETIRRIEECESWLVLKYVEQDPDYRQLLDECLQELRPHTEGITPGMTHPQSFVFVTSPGSVTPYHIDPEHNFLLQIRGGKQIRMLDGNDRSLLSEQELEHFYSDRGRNLKLKEVHQNAGWTYELQPGQGLHFPVTFPHWVKNGSGVSISYSVTFRTPDLDRRRALYQMNASIRQNGGSPRPVGESPLRDNVRYAQFRIRRKISAIFGSNR
ncbi:MAG: cupin-like domain-containing protein, partial [Planctomycetaceae bacterium]|nr:cupin-like domain-containing protein [Planctomycetaceae bacterium]